jgi:UDP-N-acetylglucosamine acyltransferase
MAYTHVAHDCVLGNGIIMANAATLGGHVAVGDNAFLGGLSAVHQFSRIGRLAMIAGGAMVSQDVIPFAQAHDNRARLVGLNLVGMKRRGFSRDMIEEIKQAYKTLFMSSIPMGEAMDQLAESGPSDEVKELLAFIAGSKRGICRPGSKEDSEE